MAAQVNFNLKLGLWLGVLSLATLPLTFVVPPVGAALLWAVSAVGLGHGLFEGVAQRRMGVAEARALRRAREAPVLAIGAVLAGASLVPVARIIYEVLPVGPVLVTSRLSRFPSCSRRSWDSRVPLSCFYCGSPFAEQRIDVVIKLRGCFGVEIVACVLHLLHESGRRWHSCGWM